MGLFGNRREIEMRAVLDRRRAQFLAMVLPLETVPDAPVVIWKSVEQHVRDSGVTAADADRGLAGFVQSIAAGRVGIDEYRLIREHLPALAKALRDAFGMRMSSAVLLVRLRMMMRGPILNHLYSIGKGL